jgi:hypothetical protein
MPNILRVNFHKRGDVRGLDKITIQQKFGNHTLAFLDYRISDRHQYRMPPENAPFEARWGVAPTGVRSYFGYVNHYETVPDNSHAARTRMVALGTSKVMNTTNPASWNGTTRSAIARAFAVRHRLRSVIHDHPSVVEQWSTGVRTDFQSLQALADEIGYSLWIDGSTLYFLDPTKTLRSASTLSAPLIREEDILSVKVMGGNDIPGLIAPAQRQVQYGLDYRTNEFFVATSGDTSLTSRVNSSSVNTFGEAQVSSDALHKKSGDRYVLTATVKGNAKIYPGATVRVAPGRVNNDQEGLWFVSEATHVTTSTNFTTKIVATRGKDMQPLSRVSTPVRGAAEFTPAVVRDGVRWEAALQEHLHV